MATLMVSSLAELSVSHPAADVAEARCLRPSETAQMTRQARFGRPEEIFGVLPGPRQVSGINSLAKSATFDHPTGSWPNRSSLAGAGDRIVRMLDVIQQTTNGGPKKPTTELPVCLAQARPT